MGIPGCDIQHIVVTLLCCDAQCKGGWFNQWAKVVVRLLVGSTSQQHASKSPGLIC